MVRSTYMTKRGERLSRPLIFALISLLILIVRYFLTLYNQHLTDVLSGSIIISMIFLFE